MIDTIIKRVIRAAIESFPIDEKKKMEILRNILGEKMTAQYHKKQEKICEETR